ncbi:MAG: peptide-methionine (R)-S-oxide reductase [Pseudomonadota bacterium]
MTKSTRPAEPSRRAFLASTAAIGSGVALLPSTTRAEVATVPGAYTFEINRSEEEWRAMLTRNEYRIMREGGTEWQRSSPFWDSEEVGMYTCKGCDLPIFSSTTKVVLPIGWVFFRHSFPNAVMTDLDPINPYGDNMGAAAAADIDAMVEVHCRRCGSHLGHLVALEGGPMHCINGASMNFEPQAA